VLGCIFGDIVGSIYEFNNIKTKDFPLYNPEAFFTDDTIMTIGVAEHILKKTGSDLPLLLQSYGRRYPFASYGERFRRWIRSDNPRPYNSWGNGSAMRVSPVGFAYSTLEKVLEKAQATAQITHNHPEGIKGAQATAAAIFLAQHAHTKVQIKSYIEGQFGYDLNKTLDEIRPSYQFDVSCQGTVPPAIRAFLESENFEDAIRNAISIGGDSDTLACITGGIAGAFYGVPDQVRSYVETKLDTKLLDILHQFTQRFMVPDEIVR